MTRDHIVATIYSPAYSFPVGRGEAARITRSATARERRQYRADTIARRDGRSVVLGPDIHGAPAVYGRPDGAPVDAWWTR